MTATRAGTAGALERLLRRDRAIGLAIFGVTLACWAWIVVMSRDMYGPMTGASAWMMRTNWDAPRILLLWAMWAAMMAGMMLPSASPLLLLYAGVVRQRQGADRVPRVYVMAAGYLAIWALFSIAATMLQVVLGRLLLLTPMLEASTPSVSGGLLIVAGVYQLTPFKAACLRACRSPLALVMRGWREGKGGAFRMGLEHGAYCLGCCWALMLLLFAGGVMNLRVIAALTTLVLLEKAVPLGGLGGKIGGGLMILVGVWTLGA